uniref:RNA-dependent RNA polymerase n=1 Tax=Trichoderma harzianum partitivirus 2 TaxID=2972691 RepID=A0A976SH21_9VIRU|nr:RNA-dependent RNA polymerase [Trichoderma harzianum partitivirus 2]
MEYNHELPDDDSIGEDSPMIWDIPFRYLTDVKRFPDFKRGILRQTQRYDPYVDVALKSFDPDLHERCKGYTRAPGGQYELWEKLRKYDVASSPIILGNNRFSAAYKHAVDTVMSELKLDAPVVPHWILDVDLVTSTSSGYPHFKRKGDIIDQIRQEGRFQMHHMKLYDLHRCPLLPCTIGARGGLSDVSDPKTRLVWMYPAAMTAVEAVFAQPLIDKMYTEKGDFFLTGVDSKHRIQKYLSLLDGEEGTAGVGLDFKSFDTLRCPRLIRDAFAVLKQNIKFGYYYDRITGLQKGRSGVDSRAEKCFENVVEYFIHTPMLLPNGRCISKHHGVPSGSHFTNIIDSIINRILIKTFLYYQDLRFKNLRTNGDDSAFSIPLEECDGILDKALKFFDYFFKMTVSVAKSCVASSPSEMHVSGTTWSALRPTRSTDEWFMLAAYSDSYVRDPFDSFQRLLGLGIAGGFTDSKFVRFFGYFQSGYDCKHGPNLLNWKKLRWLEHAFNITDLPLVYKQGARSTMRLRLLCF